MLNILSLEKPGPPKLLKTPGKRTLPHHHLPILNNYQFYHFRAWTPYNCELRLHLHRQFPVSESGFYWNCTRLLFDNAQCRCPPSHRGTAQNDVRKHPWYLCIANKRGQPIDRAPTISARQIPSILSSNHRSVGHVYSKAATRSKLGIQKGPRCLRGRDNSAVSSHCRTDCSCIQRLV
jgi:hypothetical protein